MRLLTPALGLAVIAAACNDDLSPVGSTALVTVCSATLADAQHENVRVPQGAACTLQGGVVRGNVVAEEGARLTLENVTVDGNVQAQNAAQAQIAGGRVGGNVQIQGGTMEGFGVSISGTRLSQGSIQVTKVRTARILIADAILEKGNLQVEENDVSGSVEILRNQVAQNLEFRKHQTAATKVVSDNVVGQKLECTDNSSPLAVSGNSAGQHACSQ